MQCTKVKEKIKQTCLDKYGVECSLQSEEVRNKSKQTCLIKYGVECSFQSDEVKEKHKQTCLNKYGVEHPMHLAEIFDKSVKNSYKQKIFTFPCGETRYVQGYEPFALQILIENKYIAEDIITERADLPEIWYDYNGKKSRYYPDLYIPSENRIIEVKSIWTYNKDKEKNELKALTCKTQGYVFEFWIFDDKGNMLELSSNKLV